jgi:hypothetical protein
MKESFKYRWGGRERFEEARVWREGVEGREMGYVPGACPR